MTIGAVTTTFASTIEPSPRTVPGASCADGCTTVAQRSDSRPSRSVSRNRAAGRCGDATHGTTAASGWSCTRSVEPSTGTPSMLSPCRTGLSSSTPIGRHTSGCARTATSVSLANPPAPSSSSGRAVMRRHRR
jgi:hypothetical protein